MLDSQIFDRLKLELGLKNFNKLSKTKLIPIPLDLVSYQTVSKLLPISFAPFNLNFLMVADQEKLELEAVDVGRDQG